MSGTKSRDGQLRNIVNSVQGRYRLRAHYVRRDTHAWRLTQAPYNCANLGFLRRSLFFIRYHSLGRLLQFQLGAHLLNLRRLVFYCCD